MSFLKKSVFNILVDLVTKGGENIIMPFLNIQEKVRLFYEVKGDLESSETIVFLNGVMASTNSWYQFIPFFERFGYKMLLHDFKGQLKSSKPEGPYTFEEHAKELKELMDFLQIKNASLIGTSYGGEVALKFAIKFPEYVKKMVIIDSVSELDEVLRYFVKGWIALAEKENGIEFFYGTMPSIYSDSYIRKNYKELEKRALAIDKMPKDFFKGQIYLYETFLQDVYMTKELQKIKSPTLVICGEKDILKPLKFSQIIADNIPNSEFVIIPDCGHVVIFEKPEELVTLSLGFLLKNHSFKV